MKRNVATFIVAMLATACGGGTSQPPADVWAARITEPEQLIGGRNAKGKVGDYKIWNRRVAFVIQDAGLASGYQRYGGNVIDADIVRPEGEAGQSLLGTMFFGFNQRLFWPQRVTIVSDGGDGRAVIEVAGEDAYFEWLGSFMGDVLSMESIDCEMIYRYSLGPDDEALRLDITLRNRNVMNLNISMVEAGFILGDGLKPFFVGPGFDSDQHSGEFPYWLSMGDEVSYGLLGEGPLNMIFNYSGVAFGTFPALSIPEEAEATVTRYLAVAAGGLAPVQEILRRLGASEPEGTVSGQVNCPTPQASERPVRVHVLSDTGKHFSVIRAAADGSFSARLPAGSYRLLAKADGFTPSEEVALQLDADETESVQLELPPSVPFRVEVKSPSGARLPARLSFFPRSGPAPNILSSGFGEESYQNGTALTLYSASGHEEGVIPPADYEVIASRGLEYEMDRKLVVAASEPLQMSFTLEPAVDSSGYLAGDFHIHAQYSPDSWLLPEFRVRTALSEGLELLVMTEHDTIRDFQPQVESMQVGGFVRAIAGSEITTYLYGHFQGWWLTEKPDRLNNGGIEWFGTTAPELFRKIRASEGHPVIIQVNHPRAQSLGGYFNAVGLDIAAGTMDVYDNWSEDFDAIEVFNGGCSNGDGEVVADFFDMLNRGYRFSLSAGTDSHSEFSTLGVPRVYIPTAHGTADFEEQEIVDAFKRQAVFISCGPFVRFLVEGRGLGETVSSSGPVRAQVRIEAPSWMQFSELRIIKNGQPAVSLPATEWTPGTGAVRFDGQLEIDVDADCWLALEVKGEGSVYPIDGDTPYALTNPIYVDFDGNGVFDPPLPKYRAK